MLRGRCINYLSLERRLHKYMYTRFELFVHRQTVCTANHAYIARLICDVVVFIA